MGIVIDVMVMVGTRRIDYLTVTDAVTHDLKLSNNQ